MYRRFSFLRITEKIVKNIQPHRISLLKTANETNFSNELQTRWFYRRWWYHITQHKFKSILATILIFIDYKWGLFGRTFNFFTDGRIKNFFKRKILNISESLKIQDKGKPSSSFSSEKTEKLSEFFYETDHLLLLGMPRWMLVEALAEEFGMQESDSVFRDFYKNSSDNPVKPKSYNFTVNEMFKFLKAFEKKLKKPVEENLDSIIERMKSKIQKAEDANKAWVLKKENQKNQMFEDLRKTHASPTMQLSEKESKIIEIKEEIMNLDSSPASIERMKALTAQLQLLQNK